MEDRNDIVLSICIVGAAGSGKSTFVNTLRHLKPSDLGAALPGVVENITEPKGYTHPGNPNVKFWVLPGYGTSAVPKSSSLQCLEFEGCQLYLIISSSRFTEEDILIAQKLERAEKRFYFIRTKIDVDIRNDQDDYPEKHSAEAVLAKIRKDCTKELLKGGVEDPNVFLVGRDRQLYDFPALEAKLFLDQHKFKGDQTFQANRSTLQVEIFRTGKFTQEKTQQLCNRLWMDAAHSVTFGSKLVKKRSIFVNFERVGHVLALYKKVYLLDDDGLAQFSALAEIQKNELVDAIKQNFWWEFTSETLENEMEKQGIIEASERTLSTRVLTMPVIGFVCNCRASYRATYQFFLSTIESMKIASETVLNAVYSQIGMRKWYQ